MSVLARMLQKAHAGELAAYYAYEGHWKSVSGEEREKIKAIQQDEWNHLQLVKKMLRYIHSKPSPCRDTVFTVIGKALSLLCYCTGWLLPMRGALWIEKIGVNSYWELLNVAILEGRPELGVTLMFMAYKEEEHKEYFEELLLKVRNSR